MDKLQWFKFTPSDWMMGKIQRCPEITQNRFIRLCCLYWNKECEISIEDAIIEIDKEHFDILVSKKIISVSETNINISFLDEQNLEIQETSKDKSKSGIVGNLKRWHPLIYSQFNTKKISLEKAIELSKIIAPKSHTDSNPIAPQSQNIADKTILDNTIQEENNLKVDWDKLVIKFNEITGKKTRIVNEKTRKQILARLKEGYSKLDLQEAIENCYKDKYHIETNHDYLTLEFISRSDKMEKYSSIKEKKK